MCSFIPADVIFWFGLNHLHDGVFFYSLQSHIASVDPPPRVPVCVPDPQTDPVAVSSIIIELCVVPEELLHL